MITQKNIKVTGYKSDGFIGKYQKLIRDTVIPYQYSVLCDKAPDTEKSHVVKNFENAAKALRGEDVGDGFYGMVFQDSDAAKWIEAAAYSLALYPDEKLSEIGNTDRSQLKILQTELSQLRRRKMENVLPLWSDDTLIHPPCS